MSLTLGLALYFVIWWTTLFAILPLGVRTQAEEGSIVPGTPESAPARPRLMRAVVLNTILATIVFSIVWAIIVYNLLPIEPAAR